MILCLLDMHVTLLLRMVILEKRRLPLHKVILRFRQEKNLATEMTNYNVEEKDLQGEGAITTEHIQYNLSVREMLGTRGIKTEELPPSEDIKKLGRRVKSQEKKLAKESGKLPQDGE